MRCRLSPVNFKDRKLDRLPQTAGIMGGNVQLPTHSECLWMCYARRLPELRHYVGLEKNRPLRRNQVAERQGFEPWVGVNPQRFSRPPRSTTPAPLRRLGIVEKWRQPMRGINRIQVICFWEIDRSMLRLRGQDLCAETRRYYRLKHSINSRNLAVSLPLAPMTSQGI